MAQINQFGSANPAQGGGGRECLQYEAMLADVMDGTLAPDEQASFDRHRAACDSCSAMLMDAQRGAAWLELLRPFRPEPSTQLVDRILAQTSVRSAQETAAARLAQRSAADAASLLGRPLPEAAAAAIPETGKLLAFRNRLPEPLRPALHAVLQTRFAMTAAMAFFSVALTLNLTGLRLSTLHARDLRPASLRRNFYEANAHVVRYYENLRVVYELESRVRDLQRSGETDPLPQTAPQPSPEPKEPERKSGADPSKAKPASKPRSGLAGGEGQGSEAPSAPLNRQLDPRLARRPSLNAAPQGSILPVSRVSASPNRQKWGLV